MESTPHQIETESTTIKLSSVFSGFAVLALGFGIQLAQGFFETKALAAVLVAIALSAIAVASPRISLALPLGPRVIRWGSLPGDFNRISSAGFLFPTHSSSVDRCFGLRKR